MIHLHVRDDNGRHSLRPEHYRPAIDAVQAAVGDAMVVQVTSEAAGVYTAAQQIGLIRELAPENISVSVAVREFYNDEQSADEAARLMHWLVQREVLPQYILYSTADVAHYRLLREAGAIPAARHSLLFVLGQYPASVAPAGTLECLLSACAPDQPWMACAFGHDALSQLCAAAAAGGHVRIGFENGWKMADGSRAPDNASLVQELAAELALAGHETGSALNIFTH